MIIIGIDASRNRSGGAVAHLIGILSNFVPSEHGIKTIHIWAYRSLLDQLPKASWLIKHNPISLERSLFYQLLWQGASLENEAKSVGCDIIFSTDSTTICRFKPMVVLSQDMLSYEPGVMRYYHYGLTRLRLLAILIIQNLAFRRAAGVIFLTRYAGKVIQKSCGTLSNVTYIPHGVNAAFKKSQVRSVWPVAPKNPIHCIYVSNAEMYKHQWVVVKAIAILRNRGYNLFLRLVGGGQGTAQKLLMNAIKVSCVDEDFVEQFEFLPHSEVPFLLADSNLFIFASSCENMPVTLVEAMAVGLPIACSNRGPMPEVLGDGGVYFNPEEAVSIAAAVERIIVSKDLRLSIALQAKLFSQQYHWKRCANETFAFIARTYSRVKL